MSSSETCAVPGCERLREKATNGHRWRGGAEVQNRLCLKHRKHRDAHGHPTIKTVRGAGRGGELKPYLFKARRLLTRIDDTEAILRYAQEVWRSFRDTTIEDTFREIPRGTPLHTTALDKTVSPAGLSLTERLERARAGIGITVKEYKLYSELDFLAQHLDVREALIGMVAHFLLRNEQPSRFGKVSDPDGDTVFAWSILKHLYILTVKHTGSHTYNRKSGKTTIQNRFSRLPKWMKRDLANEILKVFSKPISMVSKAISEESQAKISLREEGIEASMKLSKYLTEEAIEEELQSLKQQWLGTYKANAVSTPNTVSTPKLGV